MAWNSNIYNLRKPKMVKVVANINCDPVDPIGESSFGAITLIDPINSNQWFTIDLCDIIEAWKKRHPGLDSASFENWMKDTLGEIIGNGQDAPRAYDNYEMEL